MGCGASKGDAAATLSPPVQTPLTPLRSAGSSGADKSRAKSVTGGMRYERTGSGGSSDDLVGSGGSGRHIGGSGKKASSRMAKKSSGEEGATTPKRGSNLQDSFVSLHSTATDVRDVYDGLDSDDHILGQGTWGIVKVATRKRDNKKFACKVVKLIDTMTEMQFDELRQEIGALRQLDHVAIAKLFETFEEPGKRLFLIMELLTGGELYTSLVERSPTGRFDELRTRRLARRMVSAVAYLHDRGLVHRDVKLENFCFRGEESEGEIVLIDFGLAKLYENKTKSMTDVVGSSYYIAPEVVEGNYSGPNCDVWSLGVIFFMMLSGRPPFDGSSDKAIMRKTVKGRFTMDDEVWRTEVSTVAQDFVRRCLVRDPASRIASKELLRHVWLTASEDALIDAGAGDDPARALAPVTIPNAMSDVGVAQAVRRASRRISASLFGPDGPMEGALERLRVFAARHELVRLFAQAVAFSLGREELKDLVKLFVQLDRDSDGFLTSSDFEVGFLGAKPEEADDVSPRAAGVGAPLRSPLNFSAAGFHADEATRAKRKRRREANYLFSATDVQKRGRVSLNEFLAATLDVSVFFTDEKILADAFARIHGGANGVVVITLQTLEALMDTRYAERKAKRLIGEFVALARFDKTATATTTPPPGDKADEDDEPLSGRPPLATQESGLSQSAHPADPKGLRKSQRRSMGKALLAEAVAEYAPRRVDIDRIDFADFCKGMQSG